MKEKVYCNGTCGDSGYVFRGLPYLPLTKHNEVLWVHTCNRPSLGIWESFIESCEECFGDFSSPWESICMKCWKKTLSQRAVQGRSEDGVWGDYRGWTWARLAAHARSEAFRQDSAVTRRVPGGNLANPNGSVAPIGN